MKIHFNLLILTFLSLYSCTLNVVKEEKEQKAFSKENDKLFEQIMQKDSLLFQVGFNQIDSAVVSTLISSDFEFYHDEHGVTDSKSTFVNNIQSIKELDFKTWRTLEPESMEVFPLYTDDQELYGAIQLGIHDFFQQRKGENSRKTNIAKFNHLWIIEDGDWKLKRVLSYDHQVPK